MNLIKKTYVMALTILALPILMHASTDYRVVSVFDTTVSVKIYSVGVQVGAFDLRPGEVKTVTTNLANCVDQVWVDFHDGKGYQNIGGGVCAGSVACLTDEANYPHVLAKPFYGQLSKELPCTAEKLGQVFGAGGGGAVGTEAAGAGLGFGLAATEPVYLATGTAIAEGAALATTAVSSSVVAIPALVIAAGAMLGCGFADLSVIEGQCRGKPKQDGTQLILSAEDWQEAGSTIESREKTRALVKDQLNKAMSEAQATVQKSQAIRTQAVQEKLTTDAQKTQAAIEQKAKATMDVARKKMQEALKAVSGQKAS